MSCPICQMPRSFHPECFAAALSWVAHGRYNSPAEHHLARRLAPTCYLCGTAPTEHTEHVIPSSAGGSDAWPNVGGACAECNWTKGDRLPVFTIQRLARFAVQQRAYRSAWSRATPKAVTTELLRLVYASTTLLPDDPAEWLAEAIEDQLDTYGVDSATAVSVDDQVIVEFAVSGARLEFFRNLTTV